MHNPQEEWPEPPEYEKYEPEILEIEYHCFDCGQDFVTSYSIKTKCEKCDSKNINRSEILG